MGKVQAIKAEIERRIKSCKTKNGFPAGTISAIRIETYEELLAFIDSLPEENLSYVTDSPGDPGHPGEPGISDLEEAAREWAEAHYKDSVSQKVCADDFIAGAEWAKANLQDREGK